MSRRRVIRNREERRESYLRELESRVDRLESEVAWLRRAVQIDGERNDHLVMGPCPRCAVGVLARQNDRLECSDCGYSRFL
ncbi:MULTISPECIES: hypothetical protein [Halorussus]|uniref:hypothetical protein n=1 Tax=Halorussus TaxID=1070314 RepID=UPI0020A201A7|nr:hypothetical protein [Halorussus vallis]USZ78082.1 hypothetical protein NGM07_20695 [Halorussus vallis]